MLHHEKSLSARCFRRDPIQPLMQMLTPLIAINALNNVTLQYDKSLLGQDSVQLGCLSGCRAK